MVKFLIPVVLVFVIVGGFYYYIQNSTKNIQTKEVAINNPAPVADLTPTTIPTSVEDDLTALEKDLADLDKNTTDLTKDINSL